MDDFNYLSRTQMSDVIDSLHRIDARIMNIEARKTIALMIELGLKAIREMS